MHIQILRINVTTLDLELGYDFLAIFVSERLQKNANTTTLADTSPKRYTDSDSDSGYILRSVKRPSFARVKHTNGEVLSRDYSESESESDSSTAVQRLYANGKRLNLDDHMGVDERRRLTVKRLYANLSGGAKCNGEVGGVCTDRGWQWMAFDFEVCVCVCLCIYIRWGVCARTVAGSGWRLILRCVCVCVYVYI